MGIIVIILLLICIFIVSLKVKNKISKKLIVGIIIALIILMIIIGLVKTFPNTSNISNTPNTSNTIIDTSISNIQERKYNKISNNLYYTDELIENKGQGNKEEILSYYKTISDYLEQKYPSLSFYIDNFNYDTLNEDNNGMIFNVYQILDMAIVDNTMFSIDMENGEIKEYEDSDLGFADYFIYNVSEVTNNVSINDVKKTALDLAQKHTDQIFTPNSSSKVIKGECYLKYDNQNKFYYTVVINNGSYVNIDVITGRVIDTYFFNGIID